MSRKRKLYLRDPKCSVSRQTRWYQTKKSRTSNSLPRLSSYGDDGTSRSTEDDSDDPNTLDFSQESSNSDTDDSVGSRQDSCTALLSGSIDDNESMNSSLSNFSFGQNCPVISSPPDVDDDSSLTFDLSDDDNLEGVSDDCSLGSINLATSSPNQAHSTNSIANEGKVTISNNYV